MQCRNDKIGCYHDQAVDFNGKDRCLVKDCNCERFTAREMQEDDYQKNTDNQGVSTSDHTD